MKPKQEIPVDIVGRLEKWLEKDSIVARDWGEEGWSIDGDIEIAIEQIQVAIHCLKKIRKVGADESDSVEAALKMELLAAQFLDKNET